MHELKSGVVSKALERYTASISNFQPTRDYVGMSHASLDVIQILDQFFNGFQDSQDIRLKCYKGYQWERDLMQRLSSVYGDLVYYDPQEVEVTAFDGLVKGHVEALFDGYPCDAKTVPLDEHLPVDGKVSRKIYWAQQAYMLYMKKEKALVIFESRETGHIRDFWLRENKTVQQDIDRKFFTVVKEIVRKQKQAS